MRGKPLEQTKNVIDSMLEAGFQRKEFSVKTKLTRSGGYERWPEIHIKCRVRRAMDLTPALMEQGFKVLWYWNNQLQDVTVVHVDPYYHTKEPRIEILESNYSPDFWQVECDRLEDEIVELKAKLAAK